MSCNGCRVLRKGCSESCILRPCLQWIDNPEAQGHATVFVAKFFGRAGLMSFISAVPQSQRPALFQSLLYEAAGRTVNPINGAVGLLWTGNWHVCQAAVETVLRGGTLRPMPELLGEGTQPLLHEMSDNSASEVACNNTNSRFNKFSSSSSPKRKRFGAEPSAMHAGDPRPRFSVKRPGTPSMNSEESVTTTCFESGIVGDHYRVQSEDLKLLNLFV